MEDIKSDQPAERSRDIALVLLKSGLNAVPLVGGSIASLLDFVPTAHQQNLEKSVVLFCQRLTDLEHRIDVEAVSKEEFAELFQTTAHIMERTHRDEKLQAAANILANLLLKPGDPAKSPYEELDHLIRCVDGLSIGAITVLGAIHNTLAKRPLGPNTDAILFQHLRAALPQMRAALLRSLVSELEAFHLATAQPLAIRGSGEEEYDGSHLRITPVGATLIERFIEGHI